jgi:preprotein translocase subunit SecG
MLTSASKYVLKTLLGSMISVLLIIHLVLAFALVGVILLQKSEGGASGLVSSNMGGFMSVRGTANLLTRTTAILATGFILTSLGLGILAKYERAPKSILDKAGTQTSKKGVPSDQKNKSALPSVPSKIETPQVPSIPNKTQ